MENASSTLVKKYQNLIFPVVAIIIGLILLGLVVIPQGLQIPQTNSQISTDRQDLATLNQKITQLNGVDINQYKNDLSSSLTALPSDSDLPGAILLVSNLLQTNGLTLNGLNFSSQDSSSGALTMFLIKIDVTGSKDGLNGFISQLKQSPRVLKVETLNVSSSGSTTTNMEILIGLDAYYQPLP